MYLYLISQDENNGYDTYDSAVVCAGSEAEAIKIHPSGYKNRKEIWWEERLDLYDWTTPDNVKVKLIGIADESIPQGIVCASFNAG